jgi:peptidoglycan/xylan/chitin deacetylase (PgdA/CDA1 family)
MANPFTAAAISAHGLARVAWTARGYDAVDSDPERSAARIMRDITPGAIVLLHEGARHGRNVEQLRVLLGCLDDAGYACVQPGIRDRVAAGDAPHLAHDPTGPA